MVLCAQYYSHLNNNTNNERGQQPDSRIGLIIHDSNHMSLLEDASISSNSYDVASNQDSRSLIASSVSCLSANPSDSSTNGEGLYPLSTSNSREDERPSTFPTLIQAITFPPASLPNGLPASMCLTAEDMIYIKLLKLCHTLKVPLYGFDSILKWASESFMHGYDLSPRPPSRHKFIHHLQTILSMTELSKPSVLPVIVSTTPSHPDLPAEVVSFSFREMFDSLLSDSELMREENLLFCAESETPSMLPMISNHLGDLNTGDWFKNAYIHLCTEPCDILCPIIIFIDKTQVDQMSKWSLEPVLFTLGIFNRATRNKSSAWRPLGFIPDESMLPYTRAGVKATGVGLFLSYLVVSNNDSSNETNVYFKYLSGN